MSEIPALGRWRWEDQKFKGYLASAVSLSHTITCLKKTGKEGPGRQGAAKAVYSAASVDSVPHIHNRKKSFSEGPGFQRNESDDPDRDKGVM